MKRETMLGFLAAGFCFIAIAIGDAGSVAAGGAAWGVLLCLWTLIAWETRTECEDRPPPQNRARGTLPYKPSTSWVARKPSPHELCEHCRADDAVIVHPEFGPLCGYCRDVAGTVLRLDPNAPPPPPPAVGRR